MISPPAVSIIVIAYRMREQLQRTLYTLSASYQQGVSERDYEVIVVENESGDMVSEDEVVSLGSNFRYFRREEPGESPVPAMNFGFRQCRGETVGLMIDGAYMVTPRVVYYALMARRAVDHPVIVVPGYHLGADVQENDQETGHNEEKEKELLKAIQWPTDGYRLFEISVFSYANKNGYFHPIMECNCIFAPKLSFIRIGFCDERFTLRGGGSVNLHLYRQLGTLAESQIVVLPGEGAFHQYHGGVSTSGYDARQAEIESHNRQLASLWNGNFQAVRKEPILLGAVTQPAHGNLQKASALAVKRAKRLRHLGREEWEDAISPTPTRPSLSIPEAKRVLGKLFRTE